MLEIPSSAIIATKLTWNTWTAILAINIAMAGYCFAAECIGYEKGYDDLYNDVRKCWSLERPISDDLNRMYYPNNDIPRGGVL